MKNFFAALMLTLCMLTNPVEASDAEYLLNNAELYPTATGDAYCDEIVQATLAQIGLQWSDRLAEVKR